MKIQTGKSLVETLGEKTASLSERRYSHGGSMTSRNSANGAKSGNSGLPVFQDPIYTDYLMQLLTCKELDHSFDNQQFSPKYDLLLKALNQLNDMEKNKNI